MLDPRPEDATVTVNPTVAYLSSLAKLEALQAEVEQISVRMEEESLGLGLLATRRLQGSFRQLPGAPTRYPGRPRSREMNWALVAWQRTMAEAWTAWKAMPEGYKRVLKPPPSRPWPNYPARLPCNIQN